MGGAYRLQIMKMKTSYRSGRCMCGKKMINLLCNVVKHLISMKNTVKALRILRHWLEKTYLSVYA